MIPTGFLQDLLSRVDIVEVVGRHVELKRGGANLMGLCPFHAEKSPSFSVSAAKQFYYCFGCGASGDAIRFLTEFSGMSFVDAVSDLAGQVGMQVPQEDVSPEERVRRQKLSERRLSLTDVLQRAADFYRTQLRASPVAIDYLKRRGLTGEVAARFSLGFAPEGWRTLAGVFPSYDDPLLEESGLVRAQDEEGAQGERKRYDWFRGRVMFPIRSVQGEVIGFGGRVLDDSKPKYMNSPETPVFSKGRELYGLFEGRQAIRERGYALVVEGYMDVVALAQAGFANAVATLGTACTADHVQKLFRFTDAVVFSFDGDAAGRRAAGRALEASLPHVGDLRSVKFLFLPPEHDPDSFVRERGAPAFEEQVSQAVPFSRQLVEQAGDGCDTATPEGRARLLAQARPMWMQLGDGGLKRQMLAEIARAAQMTADELARLWRTPGAPAERSASSEGQRAANPTRQRGGVSGSRKAPAGPADLALRLLLCHADWWERLASDDHEMLHQMPAPHGPAVAWLEQQITEHGALTWAAIDELLQGHELHAAAQGWVDGASLEEQHVFDDLRRVVNRLWVDLLAAEARMLATKTPCGREDLDRLRALHERIARLKAPLPGPT